MQLDYEDLSVPSVNGKCAYDSISILRSPEGPAGRVCGHKVGKETKYFWALFEGEKPKDQCNESCSPPPSLATPR